MENVKEILLEAGYAFGNIIKTTCFLKDMKDFETFNSVYAKYFTRCPVRSCVAVWEIPKDVLCEVENTAYK